MISFVNYQLVAEISDLNSNALNQSLQCQLFSSKCRILAEKLACNFYIEKKMFPTLDDVIIPLQR